MVKGSCEQKNSLFYVNSWKISDKENHNAFNNRGCKSIQEFEKSKIDYEKIFYTQCIDQCLSKVFE